MSLLDKLSNVLSYSSKSSSGTMLAIEGVYDQTGSVKGNLNNGAQTDERLPIISGVGTAGNTIIMQTQDINGQHNIGSTVVKADGTWSLQPTASLESGDNIFTAIETGIDGNILASSEPFSIMVTTYPIIPSIPVIISVEDNVGAIKGSVSQGGITDDNTPMVRGQTGSNEIVMVYNNGTLLGSAQADVHGFWMFTPEAPLADGEYHLTVTNLNSSATNSEANFSFTIDTQIITAPSIEFALDNAGETQGRLNNASTTDDTTPTLVGKAQQGSIIVVFDDGVLFGSVMANSDNQWSFTPSTPLRAGAHHFSVGQIDITGNISNLSDVMLLNIENSSFESILSISSIYDQTGDITGNLNNGDMTDENRPVIHGIGSVGEIIIVHTQDNMGHHEIGRTIVNADGTWTLTPVTPLSPGHNQLTAISMGANGNITASAAPFDITVIDTTYNPLPTIPMIDHALDNVGAVQGSLYQGSTTDDSTPTLIGKAGQGSVITVFDNGVLLGSSVVNSNGQWDFTPAIPLKLGHHAFTVSEINAKGEISPPSPAFVINIDTYSSESTLSISAVYDQTGAITGNLNNGDMTDDNRPVIKGTGTAGDIIIVHTLDNAGHHEIGRTVVNTDGTWILEPVSPLSMGNNQITAIAMGADGNINASTEPFNITVMDTTHSPLPPIPVIDYALDNVGAVQGPLFQGSTTDDNTPTLMGTAQSKEIVLIHDRDILLGSVQADENGQWSFTPSAPLSLGDHYLSASKIFANGEIPQSSEVLKLHIDSPIFESTASITQVYDNVGDFRGNLSNGQLTDDSHPVISGVGTAGNTVVVQTQDNFGQHEVGYTVVRADGTWSLQPSPALEPGSNLLTVTEINVHGSASMPSDPFAITVTAGQTMQTTLGDVLQMGPTELTFINNGEKFSAPQSDSASNQQATLQTSQQYEGHINNSWSMSVSPIEIPIEQVVSPIIM